MKEHQYRMPGEFEPHHGCIIAWPVREGSWREKGKYAKEIMAKIALKIAESERVYLCCEPQYTEEVMQYLSKAGEAAAKKNPPVKAGGAAEEGASSEKGIQIMHISSDDAWTRDIGPTFVYAGEEKTLVGIDWRFNAWGGDVDGLYEDYENDDAFAGSFCEALGILSVDAHPFVLEGGAIHVDGEGTGIVTKACLLSAGRNPDLSMEEIEARLKKHLGLKKLIWLENGIYMDETNEHIDNMLAFVKPGEVVLAWCENEEDPQYAFSGAALETLQRERDARGRSFVIHKLPVPRNPVLVKPEEEQGFVYSEKEERRYAGERLAASYVNFYIANSAIILPQFGDVQDEYARKLMEALFPDREIYAIHTRELLLGGGNVHCLTQQIPVFKQK